MATVERLNQLELTIQNRLPPRYLHCLSQVRLTSMGSTKLRFGPDGRVLWDQIWTSFCDLALAGGPPHRGTLLTESEAAPETLVQQQVVAEEIARGIQMVTFLECDSAAEPGRVDVRCRNELMASWMVRAVVAENVYTIQRGDWLFVPACSDFQIEKQIKNVITAVAKACHYWDGHPPAEPPTRPPIMPGPEAGWLAGELVADADAGWVRVGCPDEAACVWLLRAVAASDVLVRREGAILCLAAGTTRPDAERVLQVVRDAQALHKLAQTRGSA